MQCLVFAAHWILHSRNLREKNENCITLLNYYFVAVLSLTYRLFCQRFLKIKTFVDKIKNVKKRDQNKKTLKNVFFHQWLIMYMKCWSWTHLRCQQAGTAAMNDAIKQYKTNIAIKTAVDRVQLQNECCGSVTYNEWFSTRWADDAYIPQEV